MDGDNPRLSACREWGKDHVYYWGGKQLPEIEGLATINSGSDGITEVLVARHGKVPVKLQEPTAEFPSDELLAKVMLVAG